MATTIQADRLTFIDTNVLVYAHNASEPVKQHMAQAQLGQLWADGSGVLSTQILQEFYVVATGKLKPAMLPVEAREIVQLYAAWPVIVIEPSMILTASEVGERNQVSFWDALVLEAARIAGAWRVLTEDLEAGRTIDGILIENPFTSAGQPDEPQVSDA